KPHVNSRVVHMRQRRKANPKTGSSGYRIVGVNLMVEFVLTGRIGGKDDVIAVIVLHLATIGGGGQERKGSGNQDGKMSVVSVGDLGGGDDNGPRVAETAWRKRQGACRNGCTAAGFWTRY